MIAFGIALLLISLLLLFQAMIYRRCQIRTGSNGGPPIKVAGSASRRVVNHFIALLAEQIRAYQSSLR